MGEGGHVPATGRSQEDGGVARRAAAAPDEVVIAVAGDGGGRLTAGAWAARSQAVARGLAARGVRPGQAVGLRFGAADWPDFAVARAGVLRAGAVAVLVPAGAAGAEVGRALRHAGAVGLLSPSDAGGAGRAGAPVGEDVVTGAGPVWAAAGEGIGAGGAGAAGGGDRVAGAGGGRLWVAGVEEVEAAGGAGAGAGGAGAGAGSDQPSSARRAPAPATVAELGYPAAALAPPRPWSRPPAETGSATAWPVPPTGALVHAWAPGGWPGQAVLDWALAGPGATTVALAPFDPGRLGAAVAEAGARAVGLTPALAAALMASGAAGGGDLSGLRRLVLSGPPSPELEAALAAALPGVAVSVLPPSPPPAAARGGAGPRAPAAVSHESMLWHEQFAPGSFNLPCLHRRYRGPLDVEALRWALAELVRRHEPLRSTFEVGGGRPWQRAGTDPLEVPVVDLAGLAPADREARLARLLAGATHRRFDLVEGPLFEPGLVRLGPDDHLLVVRLHHTVFDDWSVDVFRRELSALYAARHSGSPPPPDPPARFTEVARRQRDRLDGGAGRDQLAWWAGELEGAPLAVQLPIGDPDAPATGGAGPAEPLRRDLPAPLSAAVRALAPALRATPFMTVLAAFQVLVARGTGQDDLLIASVVAHRNHTAQESLVGCFTKKVPLRLRLGGDPTFAELVARTRAAVLGALSHQDVAFDAAVWEGVGRAAAAHGVVPQVAVVFQGETPQRARVVLPGVEASRFEAPVEARQERHFSAAGRRSGPGPAAVWGDGMYRGTFLVLSLLEAPDGMALIARGSFHRPAGQRLLEDFEALLAEVVAGPHRPVSALAGGPARRPGEGAGDPAAGDPGDLVEVRGLRACRSRLEAALRGAPGVADVALVVDRGGTGGDRLVACVVPDGGRPPPLHQLRRALWARLPGALWPAAMVVLDAVPRRAGGAVDDGALARLAAGAPAPGPAEGRSATAAVIAAAWAEARGAPVDPATSYWQDFSFLEALAGLREAGLALTDELVARCRTPEMLAAALDAGASGS